MNQTEFNLLDENWIRVLDENCCIQEVSLSDALLNAHLYRDLAGEMAVQDVALLRMMLALLHAVFSRYDTEGNEAPLPDDPVEVLNRWKQLWNAGKLPEKPLRDYFMRWHERFWLFHPERPFYQVPEAKIGSEFTAAKLNGALSESSNKIKLFQPCAGEGKNFLSYPEAARWLLYLNGFDDTAAKPKTSDRPSCGAGWLGKLGLIMAAGDNLFETLLLNLTLLKNGSICWKNDGAPCWELEKARSAERTEIQLPGSPAALLSLQSRRILLTRDEKGVSGYQLLGGDFFAKENADAEQMTIWSKVDDKKSEKSHIQPRRHNITQQIWRDFSSIAASESGKVAPGIVQWVERLQHNKCLRKKEVHFRTVSLQYGDKDFFAVDSFSDILSFRSNLLSEAGTYWKKRILDEIKKIEETAWYYACFSENLAKAAGSQNDKMLEGLRDEAKSLFYRTIDAPFREWLLSLDAEQDGDEQDEAQAQWHNKCRHIALLLGEKLIEEVGKTAFIGRTLIDKKKERHYSAPEAYLLYKGSVNKLYPCIGQEKGENH